MKKIVLSGSMKVKEEILRVAKKLQANNYQVLLPIECIEADLKKKRPKLILIES